MDYSRVEVAVDIVRGEKRQRKYYFKQKVEIATLPSVARNDIDLLDANESFPVARDDN